MRPFFPGITNVAEAGWAGDLGVFTSAMTWPEWMEGSMIHQRLADMVKVGPESGDIRTSLSNIRKSAPIAPPRPSEPEPETADDGDDDPWDASGPLSGVDQMKDAGEFATAAGERGEAQRVPEETGEGQEGRRGEEDPDQGEAESAHWAFLRRASVPSLENWERRQKEKEEKGASSSVLVGAETPPGNGAGEPERVSSLAGIPRSQSPTSDWGEEVDRQEQEAELAQKLEEALRNLFSEACAETLGDGIILKGPVTVLTAAAKSQPKMGLPEIVWENKEVSNLEDVLQRLSSDVTDPGLYSEAWHSPNVEYSQMSLL